MHTAEDARRHARTLREIKIHGAADALDAYADLLEAMEEAEKRGMWISGCDWLRLRAAEKARNRK